MESLDLVLLNWLKKMFEVVRFEEGFEKSWDDFLGNAKNAAFFFRRGYLEYHKDRFDDHSLMIFKEDELVALFPANFKEDIIYSHQGLTFGSFIFKKNIKLRPAIIIVASVLKFLHQNGFSKLIYKAIPRMYNTVPADELDWVLFILKAELVRRDTAIAINNRDRLPYQERRNRSIKKAQKLNPLIKKEFKEGFNLFWDKILEPEIFERHGVRPVHSVNEIMLLADKFPENILQYNVYVSGEIMAGCTMFINPGVAHAQYISGSKEGRYNGCLDFLFDYLIREEFKDYPYFDFGICNENNGMYINQGLLDWKEGFGGRAMSHDFYAVNTENYQLLNSYL